MKNYAIKFLAIIFTLTAFAAISNGQTDSYFEREVKMNKPAEKQTKTVRSENLTAPANDNFADAKTITLNNGVRLITQNNISGSKETNEPNHGENAGGSSVWFKYTPTVTNPLEFSTVSGETDFDTTLAVYQGDTLGSLVRLGENDDCYQSTCSTRSRVRTLMTAGTTYYIAVDGYNNGTGAQSGTFKLIVNEYVNPYEFDKFSEAYDLSIYSAGSIGMTNQNATAEAAEPWHYLSSPATKSVWFRYQTLTNRSMTFQLKDVDLAGVISVYSTTVANPTFAQLQKVGSNIDNNADFNGKYSVTFWATTDKMYYIAVDKHSSQTENPTGNFQLKFFPTRMTYSTQLDYDRDITSMSVFRPSEGKWYSREGIDDAGADYVKFGKTGDAPVPADFDGDGLSNYAVTRSENGLKYWYILHDLGTMSYDKFQWGLAGDKEVVGDFNRDGRADPTVIRVQNGKLVWYVAQSPNGQLRNFVFGNEYDRPATGDFDGDGASDIAVVRWENNLMKWYILQSNGQQFNQMSGGTFGLPTDIVAPEDYDGDGKTDIAVFRPSTGTWYILRSSTGEVQATPFGLWGDTPQPGDYDNDGKADLAVFRASEGKWYFWFSSTDTQTVKQWGLSTDIAASSLGMLTN